MTIIRPEIAAIKAYHIPENAGLIKLDAMENPHCWDEKHKALWLERLQSVDLNRYPDPSAKNLTVGLKSLMNVPDDKPIILGNGSDELIQIIMMALDENRPVMSFSPSFVMYAMIAKLVGRRLVNVPLLADFSLGESRILQTITEQKPAVIFIANPNNPTGNLFNRQTIERIIQHAKQANTLVVLDEAYHSFADDSFMADLPNYDNLLVMRTVSKMGLAGIRLGVLAGDARWLNEFDKVRLPYNINTLTQETLTFVLEYPDFLEDQIKQIKTERTELFSALKAMKNITVFPTQANFILFKINNADDIHQHLKTKEILIKNLNGSHPMLANCLRVTVGTHEENQRFVEVLNNY